MDRSGLAQLSDRELATRYPGERDGCVDELVARYLSRVRACAWRMAADRDAVDDLAQQILLRLITSLPRYEGRSAFSTWVYRVAHDTCVDELRRAVRERAHRAHPWGDDAEAADPPIDHRDEPERVAERDLLACYIAWRMRHLPARYQQVLRSRMIEGRSTAEVADTLGITGDAVRCRLRRARRALRAELDAGGRCPLCGQRGVSPPGRQ